MDTKLIGFIQLLPPAVVFVLLVVACYLFYSRYVVPSKALANNLRRMGGAIRTMTDGEESVRKAGVARVFMNTPLENIWKDFAKTLHTQTSVVNGQVHHIRARMTVPAAHVFSVSAVIDRPLGVDYFKHLPGILTGIGIIGTFSGLLFGLSNFNSADMAAMQASVALLLAGVRDAFYASAAAITAAMVITHFEKSLYRSCLAALDDLVDAVDSSFETGITEEYLAQLVEHSAVSSDQARLLKDELLQAMVPMIKQMEAVQQRQSEGLATVLGTVLGEENRRLAAQLESAMSRQFKLPLEDMARALESGTQSPRRLDAQELSRRIIRSSRPSEPASQSGAAPVEGV